MRHIGIIACLAAGTWLAIFVWGKLRGGEGDHVRQTAALHAESAASKQRPAGVSSFDAPGAQASAQTGVRFEAVIAEVRRKVDAAIRDGDYQAADRHVDDALAGDGFEPVERQRLMVVKLGTRGMNGDHAAMLEVMDQIIAEDPTSAMAARMREERPIIEEVHRLGPEHPGFCETCGRDHPPGQHQPPGNPPPAGE